MTSILAPPQPLERSFERLYREHVQDVYRYSLMLLRNVADAEDVVQTTFMKAYGAIQRGERPRHPRRWLITIAHNTCRTRFRDEKRRPQQVELDEGLADPSPDDGDAVDVPSLVRALGALSFNQRSALVMRELEGRSYAEIAELLEVSPSAVETLLFRARRALREQLEGPVSCGEAEHAVSLQLDGRLAGPERGRLRAHLRECRECASLARRERARRAALRSLGPLPLPGSLATWGGAVSAPGIAVKVAALLAAGVAAVGTAQDGAKAVTEPVAPPGGAAAAGAAAPAGTPEQARPGPVRRAKPARGPLRSRTALVHEPAGAEVARRPSSPTADPPPSVEAGTRAAGTAAGGIVETVVEATSALPTPRVEVPELPALPALPPPPSTPLPEVLPPPVTPPLPVEVPPLP